MLIIHPSIEDIITKEPHFQLFKHNDLLCCVQRMNWSGNLNGYVAVPEQHPFYGKNYMDNVVVGNINEVAFNGNYIGLLCHAVSATAEANMLSLDLAINVHGGITYSKGKLFGIDESVFGGLWWFGFDTAHAGDLRPYQTDIDRKYDTSYREEYRDFEYVKSQTISLAEQLSQYNQTA